MWTLFLLVSCGQSASVPDPVPEEVTAPEEAVTDAPILVTSPAPGQSLFGEVLVKGSASVWEGNVSIRIRQGDTILVEGSTQAEEGAPGRGNWQTTLVLPQDSEALGEAVLEAYTPSPRDGSPQHAVEVPILLGENPNNRP